ncbi:B3/4 domain-containing protein [Lactobacillus sp. M0396]|uniref:B3/B4 domain-containing protein n=1 Tax=Lactobacillus sp. M0396 TaxID=2751030 RepID=UPI0018DD151D|nr:B3/4 domain-containing protein [Lactobacillus sp. M0396]MBI0033847.1 B3/4 domain-containing protein [Lactobacillus sp. M0396]
MQELIIDNSFWSIFPQAKIYTLVVSGINNHIPDKSEKYQIMLNQAEEEAKQYLTEKDFKDNTVVAEWRDVLTKFKKKKGARASIEALLKRVSQDKTFDPINPLVDIYNSVSLEYAVPCGGEDLDQIAGQMHLGVATGNEDFYPLGAEKSDPPRAGEVIYYDDSGAVCRSLNWRDGKRTMLTEDTTNAILIMEAVTDDQKERADQAIQALQKKVAGELGVVGEISIKTKN